MKMLRLPFAHYGESSFPISRFFSLRFEIPPIQTSRRRLSTVWLLCRTSQAGRSLPARDWAEVDPDAPIVAKARAYSKARSVSGRAWGWTANSFSSVSYVADDCLMLPQRVAVFPRGNVLESLIGVCVAMYLAAEAIQSVALELFPYTSQIPSRVLMHRRRKHKDPSPPLEVGAAPWHPGIGKFPLPQAK